jgi:hypothetical protein
MNSNINNSIFEAYVNSKTPIVENKQEGQQVIEEAKGKKPDADKDGVPDWADKHYGKDDHAGKKKKGGKKGMSAKQAKFFGKMKKKAVKENVSLSREQNVLKENIKNILQKNGLADLVTPKILRSMLEAFALGRSVNEAHSEKEKLKAEHDAIKNSLAKDKNSGHDNSHLTKRMNEIKNKLKDLAGHMSQGD